LLCRKKANADTVDVNNNHPLHFTCRLERKEIEEKAVQASQKQPCKLTLDTLISLSLSLSARQERFVAATSILLDLNANVNAKGWCDSSPLHLAAMSCHTPTVKILLESKANLDATDSNGQTPLHLAAIGQYPPCIELLVQAKANIHAQEARGRTPLDLAREAGGRGEAVRILQAEESILERIRFVTASAKNAAGGVMPFSWPSCCDVR